jgi:outer membrane protein OmpA-like peptidoglycan-associated protein
MTATMKGCLKAGMIVLAASGAFVLSACETPKPVGAIAETVTFDVTKASRDDIIAAMQRDKRVALTGGVVFETDSARLSPAGLDAAARLADALKRNPTWNVAVVGHTDNTGAFKYNLDLSRKRAEAFSGAMVRNGVAETRLAPVGVGPLSPVASNDTAEGREQNRRIAVVLVN